MRRKVRLKAVFVLTLLCIIIVASICAPLLAPFSPTATDMSVRLQGPSWEHPLGTDALGRDMLSRALYGGRASMLLALTATVLSMSWGMILGIAAGYYGGPVDWLTTILANIFQGLPGTCFMIAVAGVLGPSIQSLLLALVLTSWAGFSRIVRTEVLRQREEPYVEGMRCLGSSDLRLIIRHILPNIMNTLLILFTTRVGRSVLTIAALSFLGLGVQPPTPDWSVMINDARLHYRSAPHVLVVPGMCIFLLMLSINMLGDVLRDHFDVRNEEVREW
ncbi:MAG: ABC transporter permease [Desulfitobacterium hafniense]